MVPTNAAQVLGNSDLYIADITNDRTVWFLLARNNEELRAIFEAAASQITEETGEWSNVTIPVLLKPVKTKKRN